MPFNTFEAPHGRGGGQSPEKRNRGKEKKKRHKRYTYQRPHQWPGERRKGEVFVSNAPEDPIGDERSAYKFVDDINKGSPKYYDARIGGQGVDRKGRPLEGVVKIWAKRRPGRTGSTPHTHF